MSINIRQRHGSRDKPPSLLPFDKATRWVVSSWDSSSRVSDISLGGVGSWRSDPSELAEDANFFGQE